MLSLLALFVTGGFERAPLQAQLTSSGAAAAVRVPRVFLDCQGQGCDRTHFRTEIQFVDWVQDRADSDVHVILTSEQAGGGGRRFTLDFIGRAEMSSVTDRLTYMSSGSDVALETVEGVTQTLRLGLMRYAIQGGLGTQFDVRYRGPAASAGGPDGPGDGALALRRDPWNFWTFRVGLSGNMNLRETSTNARIRPSASADRVTEDWKLGLAAGLDYQRNRRELSGGREIRDDRDDWEVDGLIVRSVTSHISVGMAFNGENSISNNRDALVRVSPAVEYNYFPYAEANRRQLIVQYSAGVEHANYIEETIFNLDEETRPQHEIRVRYNAREPWGNAGFGLGYSQYLHDLAMYRAGLNGNLNYRVLRGLDLNVFANASWVNDQIYLPLSGIPDQDILLGRRNLPSSYQYSGSIGLSYRWGSSFTNVVNTRFPSGVGS